MPVEVELTISREARKNLEDSNQDITASAIFKIPTGLKPKYTDTATTTTDVEATISMNYDRQGEKNKGKQDIWSMETSHEHDSTQ